MKNILFLADRLPPLIGGMETHAEYFIKYFSSHNKYQIIDIITLDKDAQNCRVVGSKLEPVNIYKYYEDVGIRVDIIFFNSGRWIESFDDIRASFSDSVLMYRTGGNEIIKANLDPDKKINHQQRQQYWTGQINRNLNYIITNSAYTDNRLTEYGVSQDLFLRCVGGVDLSSSPKIKSRENESCVFTCSARFVPYKNHKRLLLAFSEIAKQGIKFKLILAGDGLLFDEMRKLACELNIEEHIEFTGRISNEESIELIANSDYYLQLSLEQEVILEDGKYIHAECMGRSLLEAISLGVPVIAADSGAIQEIVTSERGVVVNPLNVDDIAKVS